MAATRSRKAQNQDRRAELTSIATRIFAEKGYMAASTQEFADALGILKGSIYYYIESKEDLLRTVIASVHEQMEANLERAEARGGPILDRIAAFIHDLIAATLENVDASTVFQRDFRFLSEEHQREIILKRDAYDAHFRGLLEEAQRTHVVRDDIPPKLLGIGAITMCTSASAWFSEEGDFTRDEVADHYTQMVIAMVSADGRSGN